VAVRRVSREVAGVAVALRARSAEARGGHIAVRVSFDVRR